MKLSMLTDHLNTLFGDEGAVRAIAEAGFDAVDFSMFYMDKADCPLHKSDYRGYVKNLKAVSEHYGICFNQAHAPFPAYKPGEASYNSEMFLNLIKAIECAGILGVENIVVHPVALPDKSAQLDFNVKFFNSLLPYAKEYGVKIALENMFGRDRRRGYIVSNVCSTGEELAKYRDALDSEWFSVCLDIGHCGLIGQEASDAIYALGGRLSALHVHDNSYRDDNHTLPYLGAINWDSVLKALADVNYTGDFTYEAMNFLHGFDKELMPVVLKFMHDVGRYMIEKIEQYKNQ